jgi:hypothetical protein
VDWYQGCALLVGIFQTKGAVRPGHLNNGQRRVRRSDNAGGLYQQASPIIGVCEGGRRKEREGLGVTSLIVLGADGAWKCKQFGKSRSDASLKGQDGYIGQGHWSLVMAAQCQGRLWTLVTPLAGHQTLPSKGMGKM